MTTPESRIIDPEYRIPRIAEYDRGFLTAANLDVDRLTSVATYADALHDIELDLPHAPPLLKIFLANAAMVRPVDEDDDYNEYVEESVITPYYSSVQSSVLDCTGFSKSDLDDNYQDAHPTGEVSVEVYAEELVLEEVAAYVTTCSRKRGRPFEQMAEGLINASLRRTDEPTARQLSTSPAGFILAHTFEDLRFSTPAYAALLDELDNFWTGEAMGHAWDAEVAWTLEQLEQGKHVVLSGMNGIGKTLYFGFNVVFQLDNQHKKATHLYDPADWTEDFRADVLDKKYDTVVIDEALTMAYMPEYQERLPGILADAEASGTKLVFIMAGAMRHMREGGAEYFRTMSPREIAHKDVGTKYLSREAVDYVLTAADCEPDFTEQVTDEPFLLIPRIFNLTTVQFLKDCRFTRTPVTAELFTREMQSWIDTTQWSKGSSVFAASFIPLEPYAIDSGTTDDTRRFYTSFGRVFPEDKDPKSLPFGAGQYAINYLNKG